MTAQKEDLLMNAAGSLTEALSLLHRAAAELEMAIQNVRKAGGPK